MIRNRIYLRLFIVSASLFYGFFLSTQVASSASGGLIWEQNSNPGNDENIAWDVAIDSTDVYIAGGVTDRIGGVPNTKWRIEKRSINNGSLQWEYMIDIQPIGSGKYEEAKAIAVDGTGVYIGGTDGGGNALIEKRSLFDPSILLWSSTRVHSGWSNNKVIDIALNSGEVYTVGSYYDGSQMVDFTERFSSVNGSLIDSVTDRLPIDGELTGIVAYNSNIYKSGLGGTDFSNLSPYIIAPSWSKKSDYSTMSGPWLHRYGIAVDSTGVYINTDKTIEKYSLADGILNWTYITSSSVPSNNYYNIAIDSSGVYVVGHNNAVGDSQIVIEKHSKDTGELVGGMLSNPGSGTDVGFGITLDAGGIYVVGMTASQWRMEKRELLNVPPIASFTVTPPSGTTITVFNVDASGSSDPETPLADLEVRWDWENDGTWDTGWSLTKTNSYTYSTAGLKTIKMEVKDTDGEIDSTTRTVTVNEAFIDCGLRVDDGTGIVKFACEPDGTLTSPLRVHKNGTTYGAILVNTTDPLASKVRIKTPAGVKALRKY